MPKQDIDSPPLYDDVEVLSTHKKKVKMCANDFLVYNYISINYMQYLHIVYVFN